MAQRSLLSKPVSFLIADFSLSCKDGKEKIIRFGDPNMKIKKSIPARRKSFRARHKCDTAKDKFTARYWSCKQW